jgi:hypothetical protein
VGTNNQAETSPNGLVLDESPKLELYHFVLGAHHSTRLLQGDTDPSDDTIEDLFLFQWLPRAVSLPFIVGSLFLPTRNSRYFHFSLTDAVRSLC